MEIREFRKMPFCWQDKPILRLINEMVNRKELCSVRNTYFTLTELSSDYSSDDFKTFLFDISNRSGLSEKSVSKCLDILKKMGIIDFGPQERGADGKYTKKEIRLTNANLTVRNFEESSEKVGRNFDAQLSDILEYRIEDNKENKKNNIISKDIIDTNKNFFIILNEYEQTGILDEDKIEIIKNITNGILEGKELLKFYNYWSEKGKSGKMRWQMEKTFELKRRLITWKGNIKEIPKQNTNDYIITNEF